MTAPVISIPADAVATVICDARAAYCHCVLAPGHDGAHVCAESCGGSWEGNFGDDSFVPVSFPSSTLDGEE